MLIEERYKDEDTGSEEVNSLPKTELDSMSKRKLTTKFEEEPFFVWKHKNDDANFSARIKKAVFSPDNCKKRYIFGRDHFINLKRLKTDS